MDVVSPTGAVHTGQIVLQNSQNAVRPISRKYTKRAEIAERYSFQAVAAALELRGGRARGMGVGPVRDRLHRLLSPRRLFHPVFESHDWKGPGADSEEKHEPASDIVTVMADGLKALDPRRPIREADMSHLGRHVGFDPDHSANAARPCAPSHYGSCGPSKSLSKRKCFTLRP